MDKIFDIFVGRIDGYHTVRVEQNKSAADLELLEKPHTGQP